MQFLLPHPEQIKHLKQNQHLSHTSEFPYFNVEHKLGHKHRLLWSNSSRKNINSDKKMDRRHLIPFPRCKQHTASCWLIFLKANSSSISNSKQTCRAWVFSGDPRLCPANQPHPQPQYSWHPRKEKAPGRTVPEAGSKLSMLGVHSVNLSTPPLAKHAVPQHYAGRAQTRPHWAELWLHKAGPCNMTL